MRTRGIRRKGGVFTQNLLFALVLGVALISPVHAEKLTIWLVGDENGPRILQPAINAFQEQHPGVEFEVRAVPWSDVIIKYSAAIAGKTGPDILTSNSPYGIELGTKGGLVNLSKNAPELVALLEEKANKGAMRAAHSSDGMVYALPYDITVQLQFYRSDMVAKPPTTWNGFSAEVRKQQAAGNKGWAQQWGNMGWIGFFPYLLQAGGSFYDAQCTKATLASPEAVKALRYYASFYTELKAPSDTWPDVETGLESGAYPLVQTGTWVFTSLDTSRKKIAGKWRAAKFPAGPTGKFTAFAGGTVIGVTRQSHHPELAISFLRTIYDPAITRQMIETSLKLKSLWLPGGREDLIGSANLPADRKRVLLAQLKDVEGPPNCKGWENVQPFVTRAIQQVVLEGADPERALSVAAEKMTRALGRRP